MAEVVNWAGIQSDAVLIAEEAFPGDDYFAQAGRFINAPNAETATVDDSLSDDDVWCGGLRYRNSGALCVMTTDGAPPAGALFVRGLLFTKEGQLCISTSKSVDHYVSGWPVAIDGTVVVGAYVPPPDVDFRVTSEGDRRVISDGNNRILA